MKEIKFIEIQVGQTDPTTFLKAHNETWLFHATHFGKATADMKHIDLEAIKQQFIKEYSYVQRQDHAFLIRSYTSFGEWDSQSPRVH